MEHVYKGVARLLFSISLNFTSKVLFDYHINLLLKPFIKCQSKAKLVELEELKVAHWISLASKGCARSKQNNTQFRKKLLYKMLDQS